MVSSIISLILCSGEEEGSQEGDDEGVRSRGKAKKYKKLLDAKAIPDHIREMIEVESTKVSNPRKYKTELINKLFEANGKGGYEMTAKKPIFETFRESYHKRYGKDERQGTPRSVFLWQIFHGQEQALLDSIADGSVQEWEQDGVKFCGFRKTKAGVEKVSSNVQRMEAGAQDLTQDQYKTLSKAFSTLSWDFQVGDPVNTGGTGTASSVSGSKVKSIENAGLTPQMEALLADAKGANERLLGACLKLLSKCTEEADKQSFKQTILDLKAWISKDNHVLTWKDFGVGKQKSIHVVVNALKISAYVFFKCILILCQELPDDKALTPSNFQVFMVEQADATTRLNESMEQFKALLRTRKQL